MDERHDSDGRAMRRTAETLIRVGAPDRGLLGDGTGVVIAVRPVLMLRRGGGRRNHHVGNRHRRRMTRAGNGEGHRDGGCEDDA